MISIFSRVVFLSLTNLLAAVYFFLASFWQAYNTPYVKEKEKSWVPYHLSGLLSPFCSLLCLLLCGHLLLLPLLRR
jgi:hypothetical protein